MQLGAAAGDTAGRAWSVALAEWAWLCLVLDPRSLRPVVGVRLTVGILVCGLVRRSDASPEGGLEVAWLLLTTPLCVAAAPRLARPSHVPPPQCTHHGGMGSGSTTLGSVDGAGWAGIW